jgi:hypothetical protein
MISGPAKEAGSQPIKNNLEDSFCNAFGKTRATVWDLPIEIVLARRVPQVSL